ncbi:MAG: hypothetical protein JST41_07080 [Bacteroidetes bacterium]|nr:hypothetical protein [Bacteroidota bacterium]MBX7127780.1 hypothetical protein [Flavobacteriales bacterium]MCC6653714.1 hypothetical protein [Flavobacteriales bacterium]HMU13198.1 hypothetical protein [Flavobacteriales bacterium]HMZ49414.1 hypothetical protein [Flavobacteriales bacterium]
MIRSLLLLGSIGLTKVLLAQGFQNNYGAGKFEEGVAVTSDGNAITTIVRHYREGYGHGLQLLRTSLTGTNPITIDVPLPGAVFPQHAVPAEGGDLVVCGSIIPSGRYDQDALLVRISAVGTLLWLWTSNDADGNEEFLSIDALEDGWAVGGEWRHGADSDGLLARFTSNGEPSWQQHYGSANDERATGVAHDAGGLVIVGSNTFPVGNSQFDHDAWAIRTDLDGNQQWQITLGGAGEDQASDVAASGNGSFVWAGHTRTWPLDDTTANGERLAHAWLVAIDLFGDTLWTRTFGDITFNRYAGTITVLPDGGDLLVAGAYGSGHRSEALVMRTGPTGDLQWERTYTVQRSSLIRALTSLPDGGFAAAGKCTGPQGGQTLLMRKNGNGQ